MGRAGLEKGREVGRSAKQRLRRAGERSREFAQDSPLAVGALAMAAGVGVGLLLPSTDKENRVLGPARDRLVEGARETAQQLGATAKETARELKERVSEPMTH